MVGCFCPDFGGEGKLLKLIHFKLLLKKNPTFFIC